MSVSKWAAAACVVAVVLCTICTNAGAWTTWLPCDAYIESTNYTANEDGIASGDFGDGQRITGYETDADNLVSMAVINGMAHCGQATQALDNAVMDSIRIDIWWDIDQDGDADAGDTGNGGWQAICTLDPDGGTGNTIGWDDNEGDLFQCTAYNLNLGAGWYLMRIYACNIYGFCNATSATVYIDGDGTGDWADNEVVNMHLNRKPEPFEWQ